MFVSAAWRRFSVTRLALSQRRALCDELAGRGHDATALIVADDANLSIAEEFGFEGLVAPNEPLGSKWNDGLEYACRRLEADYVVHVGSDDWIHPAVFDRLPSPLVELPLPTPERPWIVGRPGPEIQVSRTIAFVDLRDARMRICRSDRRHGVIPWILPRVALERSGFRPIREEQERGLDGALLRGIGLNAVRAVVHDPGVIGAVDWKTGTNLNDFDAITGALGYGDGHLDPWPRLEADYGADLVELARAAHRELAA